MFVRLTLASVVLAILTLPALVVPVQAAQTYTVTLTITQSPTLTTTGLATASLSDENGPVANKFLHVIVSWGPTAGGLQDSSVNQVAVKTNAAGVATISIPFDQAIAKINYPGRHVLTAFVDGTPTTASEAYQVGTGLV